jgi:hypothetical protein
MTTVDQQTCFFATFVPFCSNLLVNSACGANRCDGHEEKKGYLQKGTKDTKFSDCDTGTLRSPIRLWPLCFLLFFPARRGVHLARLTGYTVAANVIAFGFPLWPVS